MRRALAEALLIGLTGGTLGCWVVLHGLSYPVESLAHSMLPGLAIAALAGFSLLIGGAPAMIVAAVAVAALSRLPGIDAEIAVAVVVTTMVGLGALLALSAETPPGIESLLFGDVLGASDGDLIAAAAVALLSLAAVACLGHLLLASGFDREAARALGDAPAAAEAALLVLLGAAVLVSVQGVGNLLVVAVFVAPAAAARELSDRVAPMLAISVAMALASGVAGLYLSYYAGTAAGASIALAAVAAYPLAALAAWLRRGPRSPRAAGSTIG